MRLFQNSGVYPSYFSLPRTASHETATFKAEIARFLDHRYGGVHILEPVLKIWNGIRLL
jgi:hypothetical protein